MRIAKFVCIEVEIEKPLYTRLHACAGTTGVSLDTLINKALALGLDILEDDVPMPVPMPVHLAALAARPGKLALMQRSGTQS